MGESGRVAAGQARACPQPQTFKEHVSMTSARRNVLDFETALQSSPELAALAGGNSHCLRCLCLILPPPAHCRCWRKSPGRRVRRAAPACQWQLRILEEVGSCPEYFSYDAPPLESEAAVFSRGWSWDRGVWGGCQKQKGDVLFPGVGEGKEGAAFFPSVAIS